MSADTNTLGDALPSSFSICIGNSDPFIHTFSVVSFSEFELSAVEFSLFKTAPDYSAKVLSHALCEQDCEHTMEKHRC